MSRLLRLIGPYAPRAALETASRNARVVFSSTRSSGGICKGMWHLIEDFFEQGVVVKLFLAVGWLAVVIMVASLIDLLLF